MARLFDLSKVYEAGSFTYEPVITEFSRARNKDLNFARGLNVAKSTKDPEALGVNRTKEGENASDKFIVKLQYLDETHLTNTISELRNIHRLAEIDQTYYSKISMQEINYGYTTNRRRNKYYATFYVVCSVVGRTI